MGNSVYSMDGVPGTMPKREVIDDIFVALQSTLEEKVDAHSLSDAERQLLMMALRTKLQAVQPSAMGAPRIDDDITTCIGRTKLVRINNTEKEGSVGEVVAKLEYTNPCLSIKDRIVIQMLDDAEAKGEVKPGETTIVDVTSGNTGIAWGMVAAVRGYKVVQILSKPYSVERRALMMAMGVEVIVTSKESGIPGCLSKYNEILSKYGDRGWSPNQMENPVNPSAHYQHTGPEIWEQTGGKVDVVVAAYGTGGTISGVTKYLREMNPDLVCIVVEPMEQSPLNGDNDPAGHGIQGIGPPFVPENVDVSLIDEVIRCTTDDAIKTAHDLARLDGIACGISSGSNVWAACQVAKRPEMAGKRVVTFLPSAAERYFSTPLYKDLMEAAQNIKFAEIDKKYGQEGFNMRNLESIRESGTAFRPNFHVT